jgi:N-acetylglucosaminyldiphosphoundecaprenol N-acetyl-beta-D-mannosaminyltransferase
MNGMTQPLDILGIKVDRVDRQQALDAITVYLEGDDCRQIVTLNPEYVILAEKQPELRRIINSCDLCIPDGMGIVWASRLLGEPLEGRVTGTGILPEISRICAERDNSIFLLGGEPGVAEMTARVLIDMIPGLDIAGTSSNDPEDGAATVAAVNQSGADILAVAYGCPKQDYWIDKHRAELTGVKTAIGVGGAFDFISGQIPRAPRVMRRTGTEWLFRLWLEPSRARRMMALPRFGFKVIGSRVRGRGRQRG